MTYRAQSCSPRQFSTRTRTALAASVFGLLLGAPAVAAPAPAPGPVPGDGTILVPTGGIATTNISGKAGVFVRGETAAPSFLGSIRAAERNDEPCNNWANFWFEKAESPRNPVRETVYDRSITHKCSGAVGSKSIRYASVPSSQRQLDGSVNAAAGVQVCMNAARTRVKGIRLLGANISAGGVVHHSSAYDGGFERTNCSTWETARRCASDRVATAVRFHYVGRSLTGIALECQRVEVRTLATRP